MEWGVKWYRYDLFFNLTSGEMKNKTTVIPTFVLTFISLQTQDISFVVHFLIYIHFYIACLKHIRKKKLVYNNLVLKRSLKRWSWHVIITNSQCSWKCHGSADHNKCDSWNTLIQILRRYWLLGWLLDDSLNKAWPVVISLVRSLPEEIALNGRATMYVINGHVNGYG